MMCPENLIYTASVSSAGGRNGTSRSSDGRLDIQLSTPGTPGSGTNPEQLLAAAWSASFEGMLAWVARDLAIEPKVAPSINAEVDLNTDQDGELFLRARLIVTLTGVDRHVALKLIERAHQICPYSKATRGNIE